VAALAAQPFAIRQPADFGYANCCNGIQARRCLPEDGLRSPTPIRVGRTLQLLLIFRARLSAIRAFAANGLKLFGFRSFSLTSL
jgi:hypothetical protein